MNIEKRKILTKDFRKNDDSCDVSVSFIASSSNEKFGQMDEVLQQLSPKQASLAEDFGQGASVPYSLRTGTEGSSEPNNVMDVVSVAERSDDRRSSTTKSKASEACLGLLRITTHIQKDDVGVQRNMVTPPLDVSTSSNSKIVKSSDTFEKKSYKYYDICNNCGKQGHTFKQCKNPITSFGVIVFRINPLQQREYLMIRRKDTLGYIDFMRGKYSASNQKYIYNMIQQMTIQEKIKLKNFSFDELWRDLWIDGHKIDIDAYINNDASTIQTPASPVNLPESEKLIVEEDDEILENHVEPSVIKKYQVDKSQEIFSTVSEDSLFQSYKQEEMNSRDKFIYLSTKYIKDVSHPFNLSPYINVPIEKSSSPVSPDVLFFEPSPTKLVVDGDKRSPWSSRADNGMISILHYLIELSMQTSPHCTLTKSPLNLVDQSPSTTKSEASFACRGLWSDGRSPSTTKSEASFACRGLWSDGRSPSTTKSEASFACRGLWSEPEWGFPKGRRNFQEKDYDCALREMTEETGYPLHLMKNIKNILPFDEIFLGSNYKSYKHRYYLMYMRYEDSLVTDRFDKSEVSMMRWKTYDECLSSIRSYNLEKKRLIKNIDLTLSNYWSEGIPFSTSKLHR